MRRYREVVSAAIHESIVFGKRVASRMINAMMTPAIAIPAKPTDDGTATAYAQATIIKLPRELRDQVYKSLWETEYSSLPSSQYLVPPYIHHPSARPGYHTKTTPQFVSISTLGLQFAREALTWYYEHGCTGHAIPLDTLETFLTTPHSSINITPSTCTLRSLTLTIDPKSYDTPICTQTPYTISPHFDALLFLPLIPTFNLYIKTYIHWYHYADVDACRLPILCTQLNHLMENRFKEKGINPTIEFSFKYGLIMPPKYGCINHAPYTQTLHTRYVKAANWPPQKRGYQPIVGEKARAMLNAGTEEWVECLGEVGFERCVVLS